jgi:hypothetical protein
MAEKTSRESLKKLENDYLRLCGQIVFAESEAKETLHKINAMKTKAAQVARFLYEQKKALKATKRPNRSGTVIEFPRLRIVTNNDRTGDDDRS